MGETRFLAKTIGKEETIQEHTQEVLTQLKGFFNLYGSHFSEKEKQLIEMACAYHDLGKMNAKFQMKLRNKQTKAIGEVPHGILSTMFVDADDLLSQGFSEQDVQCLITAIMYHHVRCFDLDQVDLFDYVEKFLEKEAVTFFGEAVELFVDNVYDYPLFSLTHKNVIVPHQAWLSYVLIKGILNKVDYAASNPKEISVERPFPSSAHRLDTFILKRLGDSLYPAQSFLKEHTNENVVMIAPAGSGKTEGAFLWAGEGKAFFTLPLKVSSNAIFDRVKSYGFEDVALLHSDAFIHQTHHAQKHHGDFEMQRYEEMKGLAYPITICTVDQLFKFVFKSAGTEVVASTLRYSKVIIDEIQSYSPKLIAFLCYGLKLVHELGGKFLVMTATLPPMIPHYLKSQNVPFQEKQFVDLSCGERHLISISEEMSQQIEFDYDSILQQGKTKKVLVLCNTIKRAQEVYTQLTQQTEVSVSLLHSHFIKKHRRELEEKIIAFSGKKCDRQVPGIWISTQIVEASLDIDFDVLHTEMCTIDSLFQRMGRCYRSRPYSGETPNVFIYPNLNGCGKIYDPILYQRSFEVLKKYHHQKLTEAMKMDMVEEVFNFDEIQETDYYKTFEKAIKELEEITVGSFSKQASDRLFRNIQAVTVLPNRFWNENGAAFFKDLLTGMKQKELPLADRYELKDQLLDYTLSLTLYGKLPMGVEQDIIDDGSLQIHRTSLCYDFDETALTGAGLILGQIEEAYPLEGEGSFEDKS